MTMVETVARAIYEGRNGAGCRPWSRLPRSHREPYLGDARAAILALREPSEAMLQAAWDNVPTGATAGTWKAMIDAILSEDDSAKEGDGE